MSAVGAHAIAAESQKAKLLGLFSALGLVAFLLDFAAGVWLWNYSSHYRHELPSYDRYLADTRRLECGALREFALATHASWAACEESRRDVSETVMHISLAASFLGLVLFGVCLLLALWMHRGLAALSGGGTGPIAPDPVDEIWR